VVCVERPIATKERRRLGPVEASIESGALRDLVATAVEAEVRLCTAKAEYAVRVAAMARAAFRGPPAEAREIRDRAAALGITRQTLQVYAVVGTKWSAAELRLLLEREDCHGQRISVSHLLLLARVEGEERGRRTEEVFANGLNLRELRGRIRESARSQRPPAQGAAPCLGSQSPACAPLCPSEPTRRRSNGRRGNAIAPGGNAGGTSASDAHWHGASETRQRGRGKSGPVIQK